MANDRADFAPEIRNQAWWATDTRRAVNGKAVEAILEKQGKKELDDLSHIEAVQMGHVMQPVIGTLVTNKLGLEIKDADYSLTHSREPWLRSHFDFITSDGKTLVEAKNYNAGARNKFDADSNRVPAADYYQCLHEATVHGVDHVILAVLFGGQEFQTFDFKFNDEQKTDFIKEMAVFWGHVANRTIPDPQTIDDTKLAYPQGGEGVVTANDKIEKVVAYLKQINGSIKDLEAQKEEAEVFLRNTLGTNSEIRTFSGETLVTWKNSKPSKLFDKDLFQKAMPDLYNQFLVEKMGSRRFLLK